MPVNIRYYNPQEPIPRYPLELEERLHISLWSDDGKYKWTIARFVVDSDGGYSVQFIGDRPFDGRVNWSHFEELLRHGQFLADKKYWDRMGTCA